MSRAVPPHKSPEFGQLGGCPSWAIFFGSKPYQRMSLRLFAQVLGAQDEAGNKSRRNRDLFLTYVDAIVYHFGAAPALLSVAQSCFRTGNRHYAKLQAKKKIVTPAGHTLYSAWGTGLQGPWRRAPEDHCTLREPQHGYSHWFRPENGSRRPFSKIPAVLPLSRNTLGTPRPL